MGASAIRERQSAGKKHGEWNIVPGAVLMVTNQRKTPGGKLHPKLVTATGMKPDIHKALRSLGLPGKFQPGQFDTLAFSLDNKNFVLSAVFP